MQLDTFKLWQLLGKGVERGCGKSLPSSFHLGKLAPLPGQTTYTWTVKSSLLSPPIRLQVLDKEMVERAKLAPQIKKEIAIMRRLRHPNVVDLRHVMATRSHIYLVLELVTGGANDPPAGGFPTAQLHCAFGITRRL